MTGRFRVAMVAGTTALALGAMAGVGLAGAPGAGTGVYAQVVQELPEGVTPEMVEAGEGYYMVEGDCASCHGDVGEGTSMGPSLIDEDWLHADGSYPSMVQIITDGVPEPLEHMLPMLARGGGDEELTDEQIAAVAAYAWLLAHGG